MHTLILGMTESGKTTLAKYLAKKIRETGRKVIVFDPGYAVWPADYQTTDFEAFLQIAAASESCYLFIDEAANHCGYKDTGNSIWLASQSRHIGHSSFFIAQRAVMIHRSIRENCSKLFLFQCGPKEADLLSEEWNQPEIKEASKLPLGSYFVCGRGTPIEKGRVW